VLLSVSAAAANVDVSDTGNAGPVPQVFDGQEPTRSGDVDKDDLLDHPQRLRVVARVGSNPQRAD
jgi:hypothetical protein